MPPFPPDDERLRAVRQALPAVGAGIYLDTATAGPLPSETSAAMAELATWEGRTGRASRAFLDEAEARLDEARAAVAAVLTADVDEIAVTTSASSSIVAAATSIAWRAGDSMVLAALEHAPPLEPLVRLAQALDVPLIQVPLEAGLDGFEAAIAPGVRMVAVPHVSAATGARLPISDISALARAVGAAIAVDGSQAAGAIPVDVPGVGVDFYALAGETWLLGPSGTGALWVGGDRPAGRFDAGGWYRPGVLGLARSIGWLSMYVGLEWLQRRAADLVAGLLPRLAAIDGVEVLTPEDRATIVAFRIARWPAEEALVELAARVFLIARAVERPDAVRLSIAGFTSSAELERLLEAVTLLAAHEPGSLPARRTLTILHEEPR